MKILDMRGQPCPMPVVHAKKALADQGGGETRSVTVIVDNIVAVQNLEKMAKGTGCVFSFTEADGGTFRVIIVKGEAAASTDTAEPIQAGRLANPPGADLLGSFGGAKTSGGVAGVSPAWGGSERPAQRGWSEGGAPPSLNDFSAPNVARGVVVLISSDCMGNGSEELGRLLLKGFIFSLAELQPPPDAVIFLNSGVNLTAEGSNAAGDLKALGERGTEVYSCGTCVNYYKTTPVVGEIADMMAITERLAKAPRVITL